MMNKPQITVSLGLIIAVGVVLFLIYMYSPRGLTLVANDKVLVYATEDEAMAWPHPAAIAELSAGQSVPVTKCVDVKHYLIYKVRLPDGRDAFVLEGDYTLMRGGKEAGIPGQCRNSPAKPACDRFCTKNSVHVG